MKFIDTHVFKEDRFTVGFEESTGRYYLSIPVSNPYLDYEEYYEIDHQQFAACPGNIEELRTIAAKCRARTNDDRLIVKPGSMRGSPM